MGYQEFVKLDAEKRQKALDPDMSKEFLEEILKERKETRERSKKRVDTGLNIQRRGEKESEITRKSDQGLIDNILKQGRPEPQGAENASVNESIEQTTENEAEKISESSHDQKLNEAEIGPENEKSLNEQKIEKHNEIDRNCKSDDEAEIMSDHGDK